MAWFAFPPKTRLRTGLLTVAAVGLCAACAGPRPAEKVAPPPPARAPQPPPAPQPETYAFPGIGDRPVLPAPEEPPAPPPAPPPPARPSPVDLARQQFEAGRFEGVLEALEPLGQAVGPEVWRLRGDALAALGDGPAAVAAYRAALTGGDDIQADDLTARIRGLLEAMPPDQLRAVADACPFCPEGGYARLRLARIALGGGDLDRAATALEELEAAFAGEPLGRTAARLLQHILAPRHPVEPGLYGVLVPLTGPLASFGQRALRGALLGAGLFGSADPGCRLAVADTAGDPVRATAAMDELAARGVVAVVGPLKGAAARAAADRARELGVPVVTPTPARDVAGAGVFRIGLRPADEVGALVSHAVDVLGLERFAILYPDTPAGVEYRDLFWDRVVERGGEITAVERFSADGTGVEDAIRRATGVYGLSRAEIRERFLAEEAVRLRRERKLMEALGIEDAVAGEEDAVPEVDEKRLARYKPPPIVDFDAVFLPVGSVLAGEIAPRFPFLDVEGIRLLGIRTWNTPTLVRVGEEYVEGAVFPAELDPGLPGGKAFVRAYRDAYGEAPGVLEAYVYDAVGLLTREGAGVDDRNLLRRKLAGLWSVPGATGPLTATPDGEIAARPKLLTVYRGRIVPVAASEE